MKVCVLGSINMDEVVVCESLPKLGETVLADTFNKIPGGKGANQAVAASRLGCNVAMIGKIGDDSSGEVLLNSLKEDNINVDWVFKDVERPTGVAIILVDSIGNNSIAVVPGANMGITIDDISRAKEVIQRSKILIAQFETPIDITLEAFKISKESGVVTILNPAPAREVTDELLMYTDIIVPNETEAQSLTGVKPYDMESAKSASQYFLKKGVKYVIITLGDKGAALVSNEDSTLVPAQKVEAVDTTAAGDSFIGGLSRILSSEEKLTYSSLEKAVKFSSKVSAIVVTKEGAQTSIPTFEEVTKIYGEE
ncbi:ribokinase [Clostridium cylindrosporum]|uniref:Ribokinase n=1 Tax=Clostridium cylindrosporum DSM 605 TaxID=1121307 RepID=A0A0J8DBU4_CLOCY|nr:ribokinase [Clostridium cylindrosporum]KMT23337.1 ribokinase RbsK [Clostridium cylindrosporum DSM 605]